VSEEDLAARKSPKPTTILRIFLSLPRYSKESICLGNLGKPGSRINVPAMESDSGINLNKIVHEQERHKGYKSIENQSACKVG
jgi:hypothetical protein